MTVTELPAKLALDVSDSCDVESVIEFVQCTGDDDRVRPCSLKSEGANIYLNSLVKSATHMDYRVLVIDSSGNQQSIDCSLALSYAVESTPNVAETLPVDIEQPSPADSTLLGCQTGRKGHGGAGMLLLMCFFWAAFWCLRRERC